MLFYFIFQGYGYEVEVVPLQDPSEEAKPFSATPTGGYTFLGFGANNAVGPNSNANPAIDKGQAPEMRLGLNTVPSENRGIEYKFLENAESCDSHPSLFVFVDWRFE